MNHPLPSISLTATAASLQNIQRPINDRFRLSTEHHSQVVQAIIITHRALKAPEKNYPQIANVLLELCSLHRHSRFDNKYEIENLLGSVVMGPELTTTFDSFSPEDFAKIFPILLLYTRRTQTFNEAMLWLQKALHKNPSQETRHSIYTSMGAVSTALKPLMKEDFNDDVGVVTSNVDESTAESSYSQNCKKYRTAFTLLFHYSQTLSNEAQGAEAQEITAREAMNTTQDSTLKEQYRQAMKAYLHVHLLQKGLAQDLLLSDDIIEQLNLKADPSLSYQI